MKVINKWKFSKTGSKEQKYIQKDFDDSTWETVSLPHTWNAQDGCDGWATKDENGNSYYRGIGIYRKTFPLDKTLYKDKMLFLNFEGANTIAEVYVNNQLAGSHAGGYSAFCIDITKYIDLEQKNTVCVVEDNSRTTDIAPLDYEGDFTKFGGLYRKVSLLSSEKIHFGGQDVASHGVYITNSLNEDFTSASTQITTLVKNDSIEDQQVTIKNYVVDQQGNTVLSLQKKVNVSAGSEMESVSQGDVPQPHLWNGVKDPYLYSVKTVLAVGEKKVAETTINTAYRSCEIKDNVFYLNGRKYPVYGVNYHEDSFENGAAMTQEMFQRDYQMMLDMGVTAVRMAHYQHAQEEYELCDRLGLLVWSEIPLINRTKEDTFEVNWESFTGNTKQQLKELICQNKNHPSVFVWGISNELYDVDEETCVLYKELCQQAKQLDDTRPTIYADNVGSKATDARSQDTDLVGYNRYDGWYYGEFSDMGNWVADRLSTLKKPSCISEYGAGGAVSQHLDSPQRSDISPNGSRHCEEYQSLYHENAWANICEKNQTWGSFIWCMFDFASDSRKEGDTVGQNDKGLVTRNREVKKDAFYFYQSVWTNEKVLHITSQRFTERPATVPELKVYSNGESVELFVNDTSVGAVEKKDLATNYTTVFVWKNVELSVGESNKVKAVAHFSDGSSQTEEVSFVGK